MSWDELIEHGAEFGTIMALDILAFNALNGFTKISGRAAIKKLSTAMERGLLGTEQYAVEVAGFGKLIIEDGAEVVGRVTEIIVRSHGL